MFYHFVPVRTVVCDRYYDSHFTLIQHYSTQVFASNLDNPKMILSYQVVLVRPAILSGLADPWQTFQPNSRTTFLDSTVI